MLNASVLHRNKDPPPLPLVSLCVYSLDGSVSNPALAHLLTKRKRLLGSIYIYIANHPVRGPPCSILRPAAISLNYVHTIKITQASSCQYLGIILRSDINWVDRVNYRAQTAWKALHFVMCVLKKGNWNTKSWAYTSLVRPVLECGSACWDPCTEGQINALGRVRKEAAQFTNHTNESDWETLAQRRAIARLCARCRAYWGERAWEAIRDRLRGPYCLSGVGHVRKIRDRKQRTDIGRYSLVNRTIQNWNQLRAETLGTFPCKPKTFRNGVRKAIINGSKWKE